MDEPKFRIDLEETLGHDSPLEIELGCGTQKLPGRICIDRVDLPHIDIVFDLEAGLPFFPDNSVDVVHSNSFLEHVKNLDGLMRDIWRILKPSGRKIVFVPHFSNPYYYSDFSHTRFFGLYSFEYFSKTQSKLTRKVPNFYTDYGFITEELSLVFDSPFISRRYFKKAMGKIFNLNKWLQELYEENLCYLIPCFGIKAELRPDKIE